MSIKNTPIRVTYESPYQDDILNREVLVKQLNALVENYKDGFVLALNGAWGSGKTTLIEMWSKSKADFEYKTIYFNAWENDMDQDPFIALMAEMKSIIRENEDPIFDKIIAHGSEIMSKVLPAVLKGYLEKKIGSETIAEIADQFASSTLDIMKEEISSYLERKESLTNFKEALTSFIKAQLAGKPLLFFIDELDRCRPKYAVELLERLKHLFSVEGIVFVLAIDKEQLEYSIEGFYGTSGINSKEYLRRFFDIEFKIPQPNYEQFIRVTLKKNGITDILSDPIRNSSPGYRSEYEHALVMAKAISEANRLSLRQLLNLLTRWKLVIANQTKSRRDQSIFPGISILLLYIMEFQYSKFQDLKYAHLNIKDAQDLFYKICKENNYTSVADISIIAFQEICFMTLYDNFSSRNGLREVREQNIRESAAQGLFQSSYEPYLANGYIKQRFQNPAIDWKQNDLEVLLREVELFRNIE